MAKPFKKLRDKMPPKSRKKADRLAADLIAETNKIEIHLKAVTEAGRQAFLARPQVPVDKNPYEDTVMLVGDQRIPLGSTWLKAWKTEEELRAPREEQENN